MSMLNSGWLHQEDSPISRELVPSANSDDSGHLPEEDPEDTSAQGPALLSLGIPHQDTNHVPNWPGLQTLLQQLPPQDSDERYCLTLGEDELAELRLFCVQRKQKALGQGVAHLVTPQLEGHTCEKCREQLKPGEYSVFAAPAGEQCCWHRPCFTCQACGQALVNLIYFYHDGHLYCGRHHAELLRPRCPACDQLIFSRRCTEAEGRRWHENHFCCQGCAGPLRGGHYALPGGSPYCPSCFESRYSDAGLSLAGTLEGRASLGEGSPDPTERKDHVSLNAVFTSRAEFPAATSSSSLETQSGRELERLETPRDPKEDASCPCPTCSSSSDSEPEGFFLGQRLPRLRKTLGSFQAEDSDTSRKHCTIC
ncbi:prickle-like protein 4 isoform X2 [Marmota flaviventris]|uniref:prickle-like protein 4 isoform X2 n=1 Tax=Marmota flaviventris TaxID=93162 RepID=UPI003A8BBC51